MVTYPEQAVTYKNINRFTYDLYLDVSINMLKYNNDSSFNFRYLDALIDSSQDIVYNIPHKIQFNLERIDISQIDLLHYFSYSNLTNVITTSNGDTDLDYIEGYSKYTNQQYLMYEVKTFDEFTKYSYPVDLFIDDQIQQTLTPFAIELVPGIKNNIDINIKNSLITFRLISVVNINSTNLSNPGIFINIEGFNLNNEYVSEKILIDTYRDYSTFYEYSKITNIWSTNCNIQIVLEVFPFITCHNDYWENIVVEHEDYNAYRSLITFDPDNRKLNFNTVKSGTPEYPNPIDSFKVVTLEGIEDIELIVDYFIDQKEGLFYVLTDAGSEYDYTLIPIPEVYISPSGGAFGSATPVDIIVTNNIKANIFYSTDNTLDIKDWTPYTGQLVFTQPITIYAVAIDTWGRQSNIIGADFNIDLSVPQCSIYIGSPGEKSSRIYNTKNMIFNIVSDKADTFSYQIDNQDIVTLPYNNDKTVTNSISINLGSDGQHKLRAWTQTINTSSIDEYNFWVDTVAPIVNIYPQDPQQKYYVPISVRASSFDPVNNNYSSNIELGTFQYKIHHLENNTTINNWTQYTSQLLIDESSEITVRASDKAGNNSFEITSTIIVELDTTPPTLVQYKGSTARLQGTGLLGLDIQAYDLQSGIDSYAITESTHTPIAIDPIWTTEVPTSYTFTSNGMHTLYLYIKDKAGNTTKASINVFVALGTDMQNPPIGYAIIGKTFKIMPKIGEAVINKDLIVGWDLNTMLNNSNGNLENLETTFIVY